MKIKKSRKSKKKNEIASLRRELSDAQSRHHGEKTASEGLRQKLYFLQIRQDSASAKAQSIIKAIELIKENLKTLFD